MSVLYLHIGTQKTGTTAIQEFLAFNPDALKKQGAVYPDFGLQYEGVSKFVNAHWLTAGSYDEETAAECFAKINKLADSYRTIILSEEILWNSAAYTRRFWENVSAHLRDDIEIRMLAYLRRQDQYAYSYWAQQVKAQKRYDYDTGTFREFLAAESYRELASHMDYRKYAQAGMEVLGKENVIFRVFERGQFTDGDLYADFFAAVGLSVTEDFEIPEQLANISLKGNILEAKRYLNRTPEFAEQGRRLLPYLVAAQQRMEEQGTLRIRNEFSKEERLALLAGYEASNAWVARNMLGREDGILFRETVSEDREAESEYTVDEVLEAYAQIILVMADELWEPHDEAVEQLKEVRSSYAYRIGRFITAPVRVVLKAVRKQRN